MEHNLDLIDLLFELFAIAFDDLLADLLWTSLLHQFHHGVVPSLLKGDVRQECD